MTEITFEQLPQAVAQLHNKLSSIEKLLRERRSYSSGEIDRWFSIDELCEYLPGNPAKATIYTKVHNRIIPHKKFGKRLAFLKSEIDEWLKAQGRKTIYQIEQETDNYLSKEASHNGNDNKKKRKTIGTS